MLLSLTAEGHSDRLERQLAEIFVCVSVGERTCVEPYTYGRFTCTLKRGHRGPHAAHTDRDHVVAIWPEGPVKEGPP